MTISGSSDDGLTDNNDISLIEEELEQSSSPVAGLVSVGSSDSIILSEQNDVSLLEEENNVVNTPPVAVMTTIPNDGIIIAHTNVHNYAPDTTHDKGTPVDPGLTEGGAWEQWTYTGEFGINADPAWQDYTGEGILIGVIDDGFNYNHSELNPNFQQDQDTDVLGDDDDSINDIDDVHGTYISQIISGDDNGEQVVGVAFDSDLVGIRRGFNGEGPLSDVVDAVQYAIDNNFDVLNNGWGIDLAFGDNKKLNFAGADTSDVIDKFAELAEVGRDGLGTNIVFSAGNSRAEGQSSNYNNYQNSPYTIAVGAIKQDGTYADFSEAGANLLVTAPGDSILVSDASDDGTAQLVSGTSYAAPVVSGVIALILEANPDLGYRDVQDILALSSRQIDADGTGWAGAGWQENGATNWNGGGLTFSHDYGFGLVDAQAAVRLAETWEVQQTFTNLATVSPITSAPALALPDSGTISTTINVTDDIDIEHVIIDLDITHTQAGDLTVKLISPNGTESILMDNVNNGTYVTTYGVTLGVDFEFSSVAHWGESSLGEWTLEITDNAGGNVGTLNDWSLSFLGGEHSANDVYFYTNDFAGATGDRTVLSDNDGGTDTLNAAAVTTDSTIDLSSGGTIAGTAFTIEAGTVIEKLYAGDGNDTLTGNDADNIIKGARGDDTIIGSSGNDTLDGGVGSDTAVYNQDIGDFTFNFIDELTVGITDTINGFTDSLLNFEFFNFNGQIFDRVGLQDFVENPPGETTDVEISFGWNNGSFDLVSAEDGDVTLTEADIDFSHCNHDVLRVERAGSALEVTMLAAAGDGVDSVAIENNDLTDITLDNFTSVGVDQSGAAEDSNVTIENGRSGDIETGAGNDTIHIDIAAQSNSNHGHGWGHGWGGGFWGFLWGWFTGGHGWGQHQHKEQTEWVIDTGAGDDTVLIEGDAYRGKTTIYGGEGDDTITLNIKSDDKLYGGSGNDIIHAGDGRDKVYGGDGADELYGEDGRDHIYGGDGDDFISGGSDRDVLKGDRGDDEIHGGSGNDVLYGGRGDDEIHGDSGHDFVIGGSGDDVIYGGSGDDKLYGGAGDDVLYGGSDSDFLIGGSGDDTLVGGDGYDKFFGGSGSDIFILDGVDHKTDKIFDFKKSEDVLDISDVLHGYDSGTDDLEDFVQLITYGYKTHLYINEDGDEGGSYEKAVTVYGDIHGSSLDDLVDSGHLLVDSVI